MRKGFCLFVLLSFLAGCITYSPQFAPESVISNVRRHTVSIATYYIMDIEMYAKFMADNRMFVKYPVQIEGPKKCAAIIGAGTVLRDNHVVSVRHMFDDYYGIPPSKIYVFIQGHGHAVEADVVCKSKAGTFYDDYAIIKLREKTHLPGLRIGEEQPKTGDRVIFTGSTGGFAFFSRFGHVAELRWYFRSDERQVLHLTPFEQFSYMVTFPGGPGDSGGSICNVKGELVGIMYCGLTNYSEEYIFANPLDMLKNFLRVNGLENLI